MKAETSAAYVIIINSARFFFFTTDMIAFGSYLKMHIEYNQTSLF